MKPTLFTVTIAIQKDSHTETMIFSKGNKPLWKIVMEIEKLTGFFVIDIHKIEEIEL